MQPDEIRLRIAEVVVKQAALVGLQDDETIMAACRALEAYVVGEPPAKTVDVVAAPVVASKKDGQKSDPSKATARPSPKITAK